MSQYLNRIDLALASTQDAYVKAEFTSRKAAYLARVGRFEDARALIAEVRAEFFDGRSGRVTCLLMVAECTLLYFERFSDQALDRISRALLIAQGIRDPEIIAVTAAWKAYIDFELSRFEAMRRALDIALDSADESNHSVQSRCALLLVLGAQLLGHRDRARDWFSVAHRHAVADGDQASIDALVFNRAAFGLARQRLEWSRATVDAPFLRTLRAELNSARNLAHLVGITSFSGHVDLSLARLGVVAGDYLEALATFERLRDAQGFTNRQVNLEVLKVEIAYCQLKLKQENSARENLQGVNETCLDKLDPDEQLVTLTMWRELAVAQATELDTKKVDDLLDQAKLAYEQYESRLRAAFDGRV